MNYLLGSRIKKLREERKISKKELAEHLKTTRQRIGRIEIGQIDISYELIKQIAEYFAITTNEITNVTKKEKGLVALFREKTDTEDAIAAIGKIEEILNVYNAHEKLYHQMKDKDY